MKIQYQDKVAIDLDPAVPEINKVTDKNMNEIKQVVNHNADTLDSTAETVESFINDVDNRLGTVESTTANIVERMETAEADISNIEDTTYTKTETDSLLDDLETSLENDISNEATYRENADTNLQNQIDAIIASSDVVDIVGTYQELQNYDTSHLGNNDIIKVLNDSTHNSAISYYRWKKQSNIWQYIGSEGPYYTKGETDNLLNGKVNKEAGKGLSQNDFTNSLKNKLDGIEANAQVNTVTGVKGNSESNYRIGNINITKSNIGLGNVDNTSDLNKPVSNATTTELNKKINKTSIITTLSSASTNAQIVGAKTVYDELQLKENLSNKVTELDDSDEHYPTTHAVKTEIDILKTENTQQQILLNTLYTLAPKTDYGEGSNITLENTLQAKLEFEDDIIAHGDMYQGNLPDTYQQVEYIESDGNQYINTGAKITDNNLKIDTKIYTSDIPTTEQDIIGSYTVDGSRLVLGFTNKTVFLYTNNTSETPVGNVSTSAFSGSQTLEITAEIDYDNSERQLIVNGTEYSSNDVRVVTNNVSNIILFKREATGNTRRFIGKMYYLKLYINHKLKFDFVPCYRKSDNEIGLYDMVSNTFFTNDGTGNFTKGADISLPIERPIEFVTGTQTVVVKDENNTIIATKTLNLGNKKLFTDSFISRESNNWYFNDYYTEYIVTGNENWGLNSSGVRIDLYNITTNSKGTTNQYCNYAKTCQEYAPNSNTFFVGGTSIRIYNDWGFQTNAQIISKFTELYNNGKPLRFVYELNQPIKTPITDTTLIEQLEEISNLMSVNGTTKIQITGNLPMKMKVRALKNLSINSIDDRLSILEE